MDLVDKYLEEKKKKKTEIFIDRDTMDKKKAMRIPTAKGSQYFKDKKKYTRRQKHKERY